MTKVAEYIKMKNYCGNKKELEKFLMAGAGDSYRRNLYRITRWMIDQGFLGRTLALMKYLSPDKAST